MENQNTVPTPETNQAQALQAYLDLQRKKRHRLMAGIFALLLALGLGYWGFQNRALLRAAITETGAPSGSSLLFLPNYQAAAGDTGTIALSARGQAAPIHSVQFTLHYTPVNALTFDQNALVFDSTTQFHSADLQNVNTTTPGQVSFSFFSSNAVTVNPTTLPAVGPLVKIATRINPATPAGTVIALRATDVDVVIPDAASTYASSPTLTSIDAGSITLATQDNLRLLYGESLDSTHVLLHFSDLLTNVGAVTGYTLSPAFGIAHAERGDAQGHGQDTVLLTAANPLDSGTRYLVTLAGTTVASNSQGGIDANYNRALFYGPGVSTAGLSDFRMASAQATGPHTVQVTFSAPVKPASVVATGIGFELNEAGVGGAALGITNAVASGSTVNLTVTQNLIRRTTYIVAVPNPEETSRPLRASDQAHLGINEAVFTGFSNGPAVTGASVAGTTLSITFDSPITPPTLGNVGTLYETGHATGSAVTVGPNVTLSGSTVTMTDFMNDPTLNFTFVANPAVTSVDGIGVDSAHNSITFWGTGHVDTPNTAIGSVTIIQNNVVEIQPETDNPLNFASLVPAPSDVQLYSYDNNPVTLDDVFESFTVTNRRLRINATEPFRVGRHYIILLTNGANILRTAEFAVAQDFAVTGAEATGAHEVTVHFSENVDSTTLGNFASDRFSFAGNAVLNADPSRPVTVSPDFRSVRVPVTTGTNPQIMPGVYNVFVHDIRSFNGGKPLVLNTAVFTGYQTSADVGTVRVDQVQSLSTTQLQVTFSGDVDPLTVTPVNLAVLSGQTLATPLTVTGIAPGSAPHSFVLTTAAQTPDTNYFVVPLGTGTAGVKDTTGHFLNIQRVLNFFGFIVPASTVSGFTPPTFTNEAEHTVVVSGTHLDAIASVRVGTTSVTITEHPADGLTLSFRVPAGFAAGAYGVTLVSNAGVADTHANALVVNGPAVQPFRVVSDQSLARPFNVPNDGTTPTTLWALVEDQTDLAHVNSVTIDLTLIGGAPSVTMTKDTTATQPPHSQWYTYQTTIPRTIATSTTPTLLPVQAHKGTQVANGTAQVHVTRQTQSSVPPAISQAFFAPPSVAPDATTTVKISAQVTDPDGADTITSVVANLGPVGVGFVPLTAVQGVGSGTETVSRYFESAVFKIPTTTPTAVYPITITAQDATGGSGTLIANLTVSSVLSGPSIDQTQSYISPNTSIPHDGVTTFALSVFVKDPDGLKDVTSVVANFGNLGLTPRSLTRSAGTPDTAKGGYYTLEGLTVPTTTSTGVRQIVVTATDAAGSTANITLQIDVTEHNNAGEPPRILADRAYTTPRVALNDGATPITLHVFVRDDDNNIDSVLVNLGNIGQVGPTHPADFRPAAGSAPVSSAAAASASSASSASAAAGARNCPSNSNTLVCLQPSVKEGNEGQWFVLPDITINPTIPTSSQPYTVEVIATDTTGKTTHQSIPVIVGSSTDLATSNTPASITAVVATSASTMELLFSKPLDSSSVVGTGRAFTVVSSANISETLGVLSATINAEGSVVTLTTEAQTAGKDYVLTAANSIKDSLGTPLLSGPGSRATFKGFQASDKPPVVEYIAADSPTTINVEFRESLQPSSVKAENVEIKESGGASATLKVLGVHFTDSTSSLEITTETQKPDQRYRVTLRDFASASGVKSAVSLNKLIKGFKGSAVAAQGLHSSADLNGDGKVDFIDFTMFSAVYGTALGAPAAPATPPAPAPTTGGQPLTPHPDATVPVTSPAGAATGAHPSAD